MEESFADKVRTLLTETEDTEEVCIREIKDDSDLWYAVVECRLFPGQEEYVNPAGFSIGRAYLSPKDNVPCVICKKNGDRIGYILFCKWLGDGAGFTWSYYLDRKFQGQGYGKAAARLAVKILTAVDPRMPVKLAAEPANTGAHRLYRSIGFVKSGELDGDDWVFVLGRTDSQDENGRV